MSAMSDHLENEILDHILSVGSYTMPSAVYLGLSVASMGDDASGTELHCLRSHMRRSDSSRTCVSSWWEGYTISSKHPTHSSKICRLLLQPCSWAFQEPGSG